MVWQDFKLLWLVITSLFLDSYELSSDLLVVSKLSCLLLFLYWHCGPLQWPVLLPLFCISWNHLWFKYYFSLFHKHPGINFIWSCWFFTKYFHYHYLATIFLMAWYLVVWQCSYYIYIKGENRISYHYFDESQMVLLKFLNRLWSSYYNWESY